MKPGDILISYKYERTTVKKGHSSPQVIFVVIHLNTKISFRYAYAFLFVVTFQIQISEHMQKRQPGSKLNNIQKK